MKLKLCLLSLTIVTAMSATAAEKIQGAFGIKLGDVFDPTGKNALEIGPVVGYRFFPTNAFRSFTNYYVEITPISHRIWRISACGYPPEGRSCAEEKQLIFHILKAKYAARDLYLGDEDMRVTIGSISTGDRTVRVACVEKYEGGAISIAYDDMAILALCEKERRILEKANLDNQKKKVDGSGL